MSKITLEQISSILFGNETYTLSAEQKLSIKKSYDFLFDFSKDKVIYGINTGFGPMAQYKIDADKQEQLQYNLIRSHANGVGKCLPPTLTKAVMVSRLHTLALGFSGVSEELTATLEIFINHGIMPQIPYHGGVGASGDLVQLAHLAQALIGEGKVWYQGEVLETASVLKQLNIQPLKLKLRDGLALINGTSCMSGIAAVNLIQSKKLVDYSVIISSIMNELTASYDDSFSSQLNGAKLHSGQQKVAEQMRSLLHDGNVLKKRNDHLFNQERTKDTSVFTEKVQEYYSLRCVPQILGPVLDAWEQAKQVVENEQNSANDNPVVCVESQNVYHGGNFHGDYISFEMDKLKIGVTKLTMLLERQLNYLMNAKLNEKFPAFLNRGELGFNFGLQGMQFAAVSTTAENQTLSNPMSVHSISNNGDNQDVVSMGTNSAAMAQQVINNAFEVLAIQSIAVAQAMDLSGNKDRFSTAATSFYKTVRSFVPELTEDISLNEHLAQLKQGLQNTNYNQVIKA